VDDDDVFLVLRGNNRFSSILLFAAIFKKKNAFRVLLHNNMTTILLKIKQCQKNNAALVLLVSVRRRTVYACNDQNDFLIPSALFFKSSVRSIYGEPLFTIYSGFSRHNLCKIKKIMQYFFVFPACSARPFGFSKPRGR
jgi:hypothetical protein